MKLKSLVLSFLSVMFISLAGCSKKESGGGEYTPTKEERIVLNASKVELNLNDTFQLEISYSNVDASEITTFISQDESIVTVDDTGIVTATAQGKTSIEVNKGKATATCEFIVSLADEIPYIEIEGITNHHLEIDITSDYELNPIAKFGNRALEIENLAFEIIPGTGNGEMINNIFHPTQKGELEIKISGAYNGYVMHNYYLSVVVKESVLFTLKDANEGSREYGNVYLFTIASYKGQSYKTTFKPLMSVSVDGVDKSSEITFEFINENNVISYDSSTNTVTSLIAGSAILRMHYQSYSKDVPFYVNYLIDESGLGDIVIDASVGEFPSADIFADFSLDQQIIKATSLDKCIEYDVVDGKVLGLESHNFAQQQIIVYNNKIGFIINFKAYAKIIREPEDLSVFCIDVADANAVDRFRNDGYYLLANDLDCEGITYPNSTRVLGRAASQVNPDCGFVGTFDGQGHTIKNYQVPKGGMFLVLGTGSIVKNVAFVDANLAITNDNNDKFVLATYCYGTSLSNIFINSDSDMGAILNNALVAGCISSSSSLMNCVFEYTGSATRGQAQGSFMHLNELGMPHFSDTYIVSETAMTISPSNLNYYADTRVYPEFSSKTFRQYTGGVGHYFDYTEMKNADLDYNSFSSLYWDISSGIPVWK